jgi:aspartyl-tRNA synthetase
VPDLGESGALTNRDAELEGEIVTFRARIHTLRRMSAKLVFIVFRQQTITIQGVLQSFKARHELAGM